MATRSLVTGASGFVGRHLVKRLVERGDEVIATDIGGPSALPVGSESLGFVKADIRDEEKIAELCAEVDVVFHCASVVHTRSTLEPQVWSINYGGALNVLRACRGEGGPRIVYVSSASAVYEGRDIEAGDEALPYSGISQASYADSKIAAERMLLEAAKRGEVRACAIRPHVIFGPEDQRFMPAIVEQARRGRLKLSVGREKKLSDFTYIDNLVDALVLADEALERTPANVSGEAFFVTNGEPMPFWDFVGQVLEEMNLPPIKAAVPYRLAWTIAALAEGVDALRGGKLGSNNGLSRFAVNYMCTHHYFKIDKAREVLGYEPRVSIREGIARTMRSWPAAPEGRA